MGKSQSKPARNARSTSIDPLFVPVGCIGFTRAEYGQGRLERAPCLSYHFRTESYASLKERVLDAIQTLPTPPSTADDQDTLPTREISDASGRGKALGPIYLLAALDPQTHLLDAFLYFPSLTQERLPWPHYNFLGMSHRWMHRILYGASYKIQKPQSSCSLRPSRAPSAPLEFGCRTEKEDKCMQSKRMHKRMGLHKRKKKRSGYPAIYYRAYALSQQHPVVAGALGSATEGSFDRLERNILPEGIDMFSGCHSMLVSPNRQYYLILGRNRLFLYHNAGGENVEALCLQNRSPRGMVPIQRLYFPGKQSARMVLEGSMLRIYAVQTKNGREEEVAWEVPLPADAATPCSLVLENDGGLRLYDRYKKVVTANTIATMMEGVRPAGETIEEYDAEKDRQERMLQLLAYLRLMRLYREIPRGVLSERVDATLDKGITLSLEDMAPYDSKKDYMERLDALLTFLRRQGRLASEDLHRYGFVVPMRVDPVHQERMPSYDGLYAEGNPPPRGYVSPNQVATHTPTKPASQPAAQPTKPSPKASASAAASAPPSASDFTEEKGDACNGIEDEDALEACQDQLEKSEVQREEEEDAARTTTEASVRETGSMGAPPPIQRAAPGNTGAMGSRQPIPKTCPVAPYDPYTREQDLFCRIKDFQSASSYAHYGQRSPMYQT